MHATQSLNRTLRLCALAFLLAPFPSLPAAAPLVAPTAVPPRKAPPNPLAIVTDRPDALYAVGEPVRFLVTLKHQRVLPHPAPPIEASYTLDHDGMPPVKTGTVRLDDGTGSIEGTMAAPGFLRCRVDARDVDGNPITALAAAGFDPTKIKPSMPVPDDFDSFWARQKARLAQVPMTPVFTPVAAPLPDIECFDVQIPCVPPRPVSGYLARPRGAAPKSLPAMLFVHGAGVGGSSLGVPAASAKTHGALAMDINAHGIPNGKPPSFYLDLNAGALKDYRCAGRDDRERCYFLGMFLRLTRALAFLKAQPEWDGKTLVVQGSSQGGGQAIAAAGLDPDVTFIVAGVPAICDHSGRAIGRINGWPKLVPDIDGKPDPAILDVARYFDCMNLATRARAEALVSVGFIDATCPPTSVYAAFNNLPDNKRIMSFPPMGHASAPAFRAAAAEAIADHIRRHRSR